MFDPELEKLHQNFLRDWNKYLSVNPMIMLDETWPSLGVIDLLTFSSRFQPDIPEEQKPVMKGSSIYIAKLLANSWREVVEKIKVSNTERGVVLEASGGSLIPQGQSVVVPVEELFNRAILDLPSPFPVTRDFKTDIRFESIVVPMFCSGLFAGLAEGIEGAWSASSEEQLLPLIEANTKELARQAAYQYAQFFPTEPLGQMAELYLNDLIYPPLLMKESLPTLAAIPKLLEYFESCKIKEDAALALGQNLALSSDHLLSNIGLVLCCALSEKIPDQKIVSVAHRKGTYVGFLRRSMRLVREFYGMEEDWVEVGLRTDQHQRSLAIERALMFIPWMTISKDRLYEDALLNLLSSLITKICDFDIEEAIKINDAILAELPADIELHLQRIRLEMIMGDYEKADSMFKKIRGEPEADNSAAFYYLWGSCSLHHDSPEQSLKYFKAAMALKIDDNVLESDIYNSAAWACMLCQEYAPAINYLDIALRKCIYPVTILLNKASMLWDLGQIDEAKQIRRLLFGIAPCDRRVFSTLTLESPLEPDKMQ